MTADGAESAGTAGGSGLAAELDLVGARARSAVGPADLGHLRRLERWGRACTLLGYGTAWLPLNPIAPLFLAMGRFMRWTIVAHPVLHGAYDRVPGVPARLTSRAFARGPRRFLDWLDWLDPSAWRHEHNRLHHTRVGEAADPDDVETNLEWLRQSRLWDPLKLALVSFFALTWKWTYYAPKLLLFGRRSAHEPTPPPPLSSAFLSPELWRRGLLPYASITFLGIPLLFHLALGREAALLVLLHSLIAEALTNLHSFCVIVTNHTGSDLRSFADGPLSKGDFYRRQIAGTVNFKTGGDLNDALHGWLNYQIEHHLFPDLTLLQYRRIQPEVKRLCALHGLAYAQQGVPARLRRTLEVMTGRATARRLERRRGHERPTPAG